MLLLIILHSYMFTYLWFGGRVSIGVKKCVMTNDGLLSEKGRLTTVNILYETNGHSLSIES